MDIKTIYCMLEKITEGAKCELDEKGINGINAEEFGKVTDMIKDLAEAMYYRSIVVAMDDAEYGEDYDWEGRKGYDEWRYKSGRFAPKGRGMRRGYEEPPYYRMDPEMYKEHDPEYWRDMDKKDGRMYYTEPGMTSDMKHGHDAREGRSGMMRKSYMESKEMNRGNTPEEKQRKMKDLEMYAKELAEDVTEMISDASPEEKTLLKQKMSVLMQKL